MTKQEAAEILMTIKSYHTGVVKPKALDLAIEALREQPAPQPAIEWKPGPPTKVGKCLIAIQGSEDAIPAVVRLAGFITSWTTPAVYYEPGDISFHAAWPQYPDRV